MHTGIEGFPLKIVEEDIHHHLSESDTTAIIMYQTSCNPFAF